MLLIELSDPFQARPAAMKPDQIIAYINAHCKDMLGAFLEANQVLYRGIAEARMKEPGVLTGLIRSNRLPVEMDVNVHELLKKAFDKLGLTANRSNSLFCSANKAVSDKWGEPYILFVHDGWSATVFNGVGSSYSFMKLRNAGRNILDQDADDYTHEEDKQVEKMVEELKRILPQEIVDGSDLAKQLVEGHIDILVTGTKYIALRVKDENTSYILDQLGLDITL